MRKRYIRFRLMLRWRWFLLKKWFFERVYRLGKYLLQRSLTFFDKYHVPHERVIFPDPIPVRNARRPYRRNVRVLRKVR